MSKASAQTPPPKKIWRTAIILLLLVGLPLVSWYYLSKGVSWRKQALSELRDYGKIRPVYMIFPNNEKEDRVKGKVCVIHMFGENPDLTPENKEILDTGEKLFQQFSQNLDFRLVMISQGGTAEFKSHAQTLPSADYATWVWTGALGSWTTILANGYEKFCLDEDIKPKEHFYALTDTTGTIRRFYSATDSKEVGRMVEQIAILLPQQ